MNRKKSKPVEVPEMIGKKVKDITTGETYEPIGCHRYVFHNPNYSDIDGKEIYHFGLMLGACQIPIENIEVIGDASDEIINHCKKLGKI
tara:strand:- start:365 stop:631 length:267 start_codon:yes stop_codon:yes gene_type:complete